MCVKKEHRLIHKISMYSVREITIGWMWIDKMGLDIYLNFFLQHKANVSDGMYYLSLIVDGSAENMQLRNTVDECCDCVCCRSAWWCWLHVPHKLMIPYDITDHGICSVVHSYQIKCLVEFHPFANRNHFRSFLVHISLALDFFSLCAQHFNN